MFSFQPCEIRWPFLRGIRTLSSLFDKNNVNKVSDVVVVPGHVAVLVHSSSVLILFDAVPSEYQLGEAEQRNLSAFLQQQPKEAEFTNEAKSFAPTFLIALHNSPVRSLWFEKSKRQHYLHLFACQEDGHLSCWVWLPHKWSWQQVGKKTLLPPTRDLGAIGRTEPGVERVVTNVVSSKYGTKRKQLLVWCETYRQKQTEERNNEGIEKKNDEDTTQSKDPTVTDDKSRLCWSEITLSIEDTVEEKRPSPRSVSAPPAIPSTIALGRSTFADTIDEDVEKVFASKEGVWLITTRTLYYWPFVTRTLIPKSLQSRTNQGTILAAALHTITQELILLDSTGQLFLCTLEEATASTRGTPLSGSMNGAPGTPKSRHKDWVSEIAGSERLSLIRSSSSGSGLLRRRWSISLTPFSKCQGLLKGKKELLAGYVVDFCVHQHVAGIVTIESCKFFDLRTGVFLEEQFLPKSLTGDVGLKGSARNTGILLKVSGASLTPLPPRVNARQGGLWRIGALGIEGTNVGLWGTGGMWLIQMPKVVKQAEVIAQAPLSRRGVPLPAGAGSNATDAALLCKDWGLARWHARYLFDEAMNARQKQKGSKNQKEKEKETGKEKLREGSSLAAGVQQVEGEGEEEGKVIKKICEELLPYLENPAIVVGLLAQTPEHRPYVIKELSNFLEKTSVNYSQENEGGTGGGGGTGGHPKRPKTNSIKGTGGGGYGLGYPLKYESILSSEAEREQRKTAFHYYTPLNRKMQPLLSRYLELSLQMNAQNFLPDSPTSALTNSPTTTPSTSSSFSSLLAATKIPNLKSLTSVEMLKELSRAELEMLERDKPVLLLEKLQQLLLPSNFEEETIKYSRTLALEAKEEGYVASAKGDILLGRWLSCFNHSPPHAALYHAEETLDASFGHVKEQENDKLQSKRLNAGRNQMRPHHSISIGASFVPGGFLFPQEDDDDEPLDGPSNDPRPKEHPFFEIMCRLFFKEKPELLCPFVKVVSYFVPSPFETSFFARASAALPPIVFPLLPAATTSSRKAATRPNATSPYLSARSKEDVQLKARVELLCWDGKSEAALRMLLRMGKWQSAVDIVEKRVGKYTGRRRRELEAYERQEERRKQDARKEKRHKRKDKEREEQEKGKEKEKGVEADKDKQGRKSLFTSLEAREGLAIASTAGDDEMEIDVGGDEGGEGSLNHFELFHVLLTHCLELKDPRKLEQCWPLMPQSFGAFDLLRLTRLSENRGKHKQQQRNSQSYPPALVATDRGSGGVGGVLGGSGGTTSMTNSGVILTVSGAMMPSYSSIFVKDDEEDEKEEDEEDDEEEDTATSETIDEEDEDEEDEEDEERAEENEYSVAHFRPQLMTMFRRMKLQHQQQNEGNS